jgi:hypothetical protein
VTVPSEKAPFTEPYALAGNDSGFKSKGNTALAVKRALAHLGFLEWEPEKWDNAWNDKVNDAAAAWKRKRGLIPTDSKDGSWGKHSHDVMRGTWFDKNGEKLDAFDAESQRLLQEEKRAASPPPSGDAITRVRKAITSFCEQGIGEPDWYYSQARAIDKSINPNGPATSDCSGSVIQIFWYAAKQTGVNVPDPAKQGWSGYGNTNYYEDDWPKVTSWYEVGDMAHYDGHVCLCYHPGNADTADWWSFGSEPPSKRKLHYRTDFRFVVRPKLVA